MSSKYSVAVTADVMVRMRDGVLLATDIYRPARGGAAVAGQFPVILERTPYGKLVPSRSELDIGQIQPYSREEIARYFVERGYVVVYQDCRGSYDSQGHFEKYLSEADDGEDLMRWIVEQAWCNGKVGTMGLSYAAHAQFALATKSPPGLATMILDCGGFADAYHCGARQGGAFEMKQVTWAVQHAREALRDDPVASRALEMEDLREWFKVMPWRQGHSPLRWAPDYEKYLFEQWENADFGDYWRQPSLYAKGSYARMPAVPQVHLSGWYDVYVRSTLENYQAMAAKHDDVHLIMGPWLHGDRNITCAGDVEFGSAAALDGNIASHWREFRLQWFDRTLKGKAQAQATGHTALPKVLIFLMGGGSGRCDKVGRLEHGGRWIQADAWPLPEAVPTTLYLHPDHSLRLEPAQATSPPLTYDFDPRRPVPTLGGSLTSGRPIFSGGAFDQREGPRFFGCTSIGMPTSARHDVVVFETPPLETDLAVVGNVVARLHVSSNCPDTDFTIKLIDLHPPTLDYPQGFAMNISDGILRCRYRKSFETPEPMVEGEIYPITIEAFATANLFKAGHRIRLDISSSNFPKFDINPNTGENFVNARLTRIATNSIHIGAAYPSSLELSVVPASALRAWARDGGG